MRSLPPLFQSMLEGSHLMGINDDWAGRTVLVVSNDHPSSRSNDEIVAHVIRMREREKEKERERERERERENLRSAWSCKGLPSGV